VILESARIVLAAVLLIGGLGKLTDRKGRHAALREFGVPAWGAGTLGWALIGAELATATALLFGPWHEWAAAGALALLAIVSGAVAANLIRGRAPVCHCFGRLSRGPVGWSTLARNGVLVAVAAYVATSGREPALFLGFGFLFGATWLALSAVAPRTRRGAEAPRFALSDAGGTRWTREALLEEARPVLLVFSQPGCGACQALLGDLQDWQTRLGDQLSIAVVSQSRTTDPGDPESEQFDYQVLLDPGGTTASAYGVTATPSAVLIDTNSRMAAPIAQGAGEIEKLVAARFDQNDSPRLPRRAAILQVARGATTLGAFPLLAAACGSSQSSSSAGSSSATTSTSQANGATGRRPTSVRAAGTYICQQRYALCTNAACRPSPHDPNTVICDCVVKGGYSVGLLPCSHRAPHGTALHSTFSTELVTSSSRAMTCPADVAWANCVDSPCRLDPSNPDKATCLCPVVKKGPSFTFGGDCNTKTCGKTIWSGAHTTLGGSAVAAAMKRLGQPLSAPASCPKS
jgi:cytochrome oxidase Cu insertion factor (SCO1/SenC/PrrC family)